MGNKTFISYAYTENNKISVDELARSLGAFGLDVFVAPDGIGGGERWAKTIIKEIRESDLFLALITKEYHEHEFTEQELGMAIYADKRIICLTDGGKPGGFVKDRQYKQFGYETDRIAEKIVEDAIELFGKQEDRIDFVIECLKDSRHYRNSNFLTNLLTNQLKNTSLTGVQTTSLANAFLENRQVYEAKLANHIARILYKYKNQLESSLWGKVEYVCEKAELPLTA